MDHEYDELKTSEGDASFREEAPESGRDADEPLREINSGLSSLVQPIPGDNPAGINLRYEPIYDQIQKAREEEADLPQGVWERKRIKANWNTVRDLCVQALTQQSKDLQVAAWLLEALLHLHGFLGLKTGLRVINELCRTFWEHLYPEIEADEDYESRASPLIWINEKLFLVLKMVEITKPQSENAFAYSYADWESANHLEKLAFKNESVLVKAEEKGRVTKAKFYGSVLFTPRDFYEEQTLLLSDNCALLEELEQHWDEQCGNQAPSLKQFKRTLTDIQFLLEDILAKKRNENGVSEENLSEEALREGDPESRETGRKPVVHIRNRSEAYRVLSEAADYLMLYEPHSPTPYLVKRAVSWGSMSLNELLGELVNEERDLHQIYKLLGMM